MKTGAWQIFGSQSLIPQSPCKFGMVFRECNSLKRETFSKGPKFFASGKIQTQRIQVQRSHVYNLSVAKI